LWKGIVGESMDEAFVENKANVPWRAGGAGGAPCGIDVRPFEPGAVIHHPSPELALAGGRRSW